MSAWEGLNPPYATIVVDPPWDYPEGWPPSLDRNNRHFQTQRIALPYSSMSVEDVRALPVCDLAANDAHLYLWTTNRYLERSFEVVRAWGFRPSQVLVWCKNPEGLGPGGAFASTTEFIVFGRRGSLVPLERSASSWFAWPRVGRKKHSTKPAGMLDVVERVSPGPYVELFARAPRLGWDHWGFGYEVAS